MAQITKRQGQYDIEEYVGDPEDSKLMTGNMTVGHGKHPTGSFSAKVTSSMVTDVNQDRENARRAWMQIFDDSYDALLEKLSAARAVAMGEQDENGNKKPGMQTNLLAGTDAMKAAAKGSPKTDTSGGKSTVKTAKKPADKKATAKKGPGRPKKVMEPVKD